MFCCILLLLCFTTLSYCNILQSSFILNDTLVEERMITTEIWTNRLRGITEMNRAFESDIVTDTIGYTISDVGDYISKPYAYEYNYLVVGLKPILGYDSIRYNVSFDKYKTKWISTDILVVTKLSNVITGYNATTQTYKYYEYGFVQTEYIRFESNTARIDYAYTDQDPALSKLIKAAQALFPISADCFGIIIPACNGTLPGNSTPRIYLNETGFTDATDCIIQLSSLPPSICPFPYRSNTYVCRSLHSFMALLDPELHCSHTRKLNNMPCKDTCLPVCSSCHVNAECVAIQTYPPTTTINYKCQCKNGYVGDGTLSCLPKSCPSNNCPGTLYGSYTCLNGLCTCNETYIPLQNASGNNPLCICKDGNNRIFYKNSKPICVPIGRCLDDKHYQCTTGNGGLQSYNQVKCTTFDNEFSLFNHCICNYGFTGGLLFPCGCDINNTIVYSDIFKGEICLKPNECTLDTIYKCGNNQCIVQPGESIGLCSTTKRSLIMI